MSQVNSRQAKETAMSRLTLNRRNAMLRTTSRFVSVLFVLSLAAFCAATAQADSAAWIGTIDANWANLGNWDGTPVAVPGTGNTATFNGAAGAGGAVIDLGAGVTINTILFDTANAAAYTIGSGAVGSQTLILDDSGAVTMNATVASNELFNANILLGTATAGTYTFTNNSATNALTFAGGVQGGAGGTGDAKTLTVTGAGNTGIGGIIANGGASALALTKDGAGTLTLTGVNSFTGQLSVQSGTLSIATANSVSVAGPLGNSALSVILGGSGQTGTLQYTGATVTSTKPFTMAAGGAGVFQVDSGATNLTISGLISGSGAMSKTGAGT